MIRISNVHRLLVGKPEGNRLLERHGHRWEVNIKMDLKIIGWAGMD
jgi:6-pyruvoyl-tetrahydropterin synthase